MESYLTAYLLNVRDEPVPDPKDCRDDYETLSNVSFKVLFFLSLISLVICLQNGYLMWRSQRLQSSVPLALFLGFSVLTLVVLILLFLDVYVKYDCTVFNVFMKMPTFTYVSLAYSYMMNW